MIVFLIRIGADVNATIRDTRRIPTTWSNEFHGCSTPLAIAAAQNNISAIKLLLEYGEQVEGRDTTGILGSGCSALSASVSNDHYDASKLLLDSGADVNSVIDYDMNMIFNDKSILRLLIGPGLNKVSLYGFMCYAAE